MAKRIVAAFWYTVHNAVAHPLLLTRSEWSWRFHDWTADRMEAQHA